MKRAFLTIISLFLFIGTMMAGTDKDGHSLVSLWKKYYAAEDADLPRKQLQILQEIKDKAKKKSLALDFWDAQEKYLSVVEDMEWKDADSLRACMLEEALAFPDPIVGFSYMEYTPGLRLDSEEFEFVQKNKDKLKENRNKVFYNWLYSYTGWGSSSWKLLDVYKTLIKDDIESDYEFVLWQLFFNESEPGSEPEKLLREIIGNSYPKYPALCFIAACKPKSKPENRVNSLKEVINLCNGKPLRLYPQAILLEMRMDSLQNNKKATSQQFRQIRQEAEKLEQLRLSYLGEEKELMSKLHYFQTLIQNLDGKHITIDGILDGDTPTALVLFKNEKKANLTVASKSAPDKILFKQECIAKNDKYFITDTVKVPMPAFEDGEYYVDIGGGKNLMINYENGICIKYSKFSYALALRQDKDGFGFLATNSKTGVPLTEGELVLENNDNIIATTKVKMIQDGFTPLPAPINSLYDSKNHSIYIRGKDSTGNLLRSPSIKYGEDRHSPNKKDVVKGASFLNIAAIKPGETIKYKLVVYKTSADGHVSLAEKGSEIKLFLYAPDGNLKEERTVKVTGLGSLSTDYTLPEGSLSGNYLIAAFNNYDLISGASFYYGDVVLPSFDCIFDPTDKPIFPGDTVHITGILRSYSGHKLSDAKIKYTISFAHHPQVIVKEGQIIPFADGSFDIPFKTKPNSYLVSLDVTDITGETLNFSKRLSCDDYYRISVELDNANNAYYYKQHTKVITEPVAKFTTKITIDDRVIDNAHYSYQLRDNRKNVLLAGDALSGEPLELDWSELNDDQYELIVRYDIYKGEGNGDKEKIVDKEYKEYKEYKESILKYSEGKDVPDGIEYLFKSTCMASPDGFLDFSIGSSEHDIWGFAELNNSAKEILWHDLVYVPKGKIDSFRIPYPESYDNVTAFRLIYFYNYKNSVFERTFSRATEEYSLPMEIVSFRDECRPGEKVSVEITGCQDAEAVASVWDKATDSIFGLKNDWHTIKIIRTPISLDILSSYSWPLFGRNYIKRYLYTHSSAKPIIVRGATSIHNDSPFLYGYRSSSLDIPIFVSPREDFSEALYFEPFLKADAEGKIRFTFKASDKLSTYYVAVFAHDKDMRNNLIKKELKVTLPVKVDVLKPEYLVCGDKFTLAATVSSMVEDNIPGQLTVYTFDNPDYSNSKPLSSRVVDAVVPAGSVFSKDFEIPVPDAKAENAQLYILVSFKADNGTSDAMFFKVPMLERAQTITEAHSAVLLSGMDKEALLNELRGRFTGTTHFGAEYAEISILDMVREALQQKLQDPGKDVLSLTEALYVRTVLAGMPGQAGHDVTGHDVTGHDVTGHDVAGHDVAGHDVAGHDVTGHDAVIAGNDRQSLLKDILALQNPDGGFAWFKEFSSSPVLTAVVLERFKKMAGQDGPSLPAEACNLAVKYLDTEHFEGDKPWWWGGLSDAQYMYIRALYAEVPFTAPKTAAKRFDDFKKVAKEYLTPDKARGLNGYIMAKARRLNTLRLLLASEEGLALAKAWGIKKSAKIEESMKADVASLLEYAVKHRDGGIYYPNAVMPWRGLLETEAYAHAQLAALLPEVADGIRLWLMLQKETQHWDVTPDFVDAIACILDGSKEVLGTKVLTVSKTYRKPLEEIVAAGNGFTIARSFYKEVVKADGSIINQELSLGDPIKKGEKIVALYKIYNAENRSFVRVRVPREATLRPVDQLSGRMGWWRRFQGYRDVRTSYTDYFFDSMAEENSEIREEFFVTQTGTFACGVPVVESLYAPHYRANDGFKGPMKVKN